MRSAVNAFSPAANQGGSAPDIDARSSSRATRQHATIQHTHHHHPSRVAHNTYNFSTVAHLRRLASRPAAAARARPAARRSSPAVTRAARPPPRASGRAPARRHGACDGVQQCATVCNGVQRCATVCNGVQRYVTVCNALRLGLWSHARTCGRQTHCVRLTHRYTQPSRACTSDRAAAATRTARGLRTRAAIITHHSSLLGTRAAPDAGIPQRRPPSTRGEHATARLAT